MFFKIDSIDVFLHIGDKSCVGCVSVRKWLFSYLHYE